MRPQGGFLGSTARAYHLHNSLADGSTHHTTTYDASPLYDSQATLNYSINRPTQPGSKTRPIQSAESPPSTTSHYVALSAFPSRLREDSKDIPAGTTRDDEEHLLALGGLGAAAGGVSARAAVGLDVSAGSLVLHPEAVPCAQGRSTGPTHRHVVRVCCVVGD